MSNDLTSLARSVNKISNSLTKLGVDMEALTVTSAAFELVGGTSQIIKGIIAAKEAVIAYKAAEGTAQLAKYTVGAAAVAGLALAGGIAMGMMIEQHTGGLSDDGRGASIIEQIFNTTDNGQGMRAIAGGHTNGRY